MHMNSSTGGSERIPEEKIPLLGREWKGETT